MDAPLLPIPTPVAKALEDILARADRGKSVAGAVLALETALQPLLRLATTAEELVDARRCGDVQGQHDATRALCELVDKYRRAMATPCDHEGQAKPTTSPAAAPVDTHTDEAILARARAVTGPQRVALAWYASAPSGMRRGREPGLAVRKRLQDAHLVDGCSVYDNITPLGVDVLAVLANGATK